MNKKTKIIIIVSLLMLILGISVIVWLVAAHQTKQEAKEKIGIEKVLDKDRTLGAKDVVKKSDVEKAFKGLAKNVKDGEVSGVLNENAFKGRNSETYSFKMTSVRNEQPVIFDVNVVEYDNPEVLSASNPFIGTEDEQIDGVGERARYYIPNDVKMSVKQIGIIAVIQKVSYKFSIEEPSDNPPISEKAAKRAILEIAKKANLDAVK